MPHPASSPSICDLFRRQIDAGELRPGQALPSTRALAQELGVSRSTVVNVYEQLVSEGYIETRPGARSRVAPGAVQAAKRHRPVQAAQRGAPRPLSAYGQRTAQMPLVLPSSDSADINFLYGAVAEDDFPKLLWRRLYNQVLMQRQPALYYGPPEGSVELRAALQDYLLRARGLSCTQEQIIVVQGSQQAIDLCARLLVDPGAAVLMEEPCYQRAHAAFAAVGADITPIPVDEQGLMTPLLPDTRHALAYVTPSHQFPLGPVLSIGRRRELLAWAARNRCWIIEDDYDSEFRYGLQPTQPLHALDGEGCVLYMGTFSKTLSPQLRLGYLVLPHALVPVFRQAKLLTDRHAPYPEQQVVARFIRSGAYERHIRRVRRANEHRRTVLVDAIQRFLPARVEVEGTASGLHIVVWLHDLTIDQEPQLMAQARARGVGLWSITPLYAAGQRLRRHPCAGLVMGYAGLTPERIVTGVERMAQALQACLPR